MMTKTLVRHGNSLALVIDKPVLELLNISSDTPLDVRTDGRALIIEPTRDSARKAKFAKAVAKTNARYGRTLKKLAE